MKHDIKRCVSLLMLLSCFSLSIGSSNKDPEQLGTHHYNKCNYDEALKHFLQAKELDPANPKHHLHIAKTYLQKDEYTQALKAITPLKNIDSAKEPNLYLDFLWTTGNIYRHMHEFATAKEYFTQITAVVDNDNYRHMWLAGNAYSALNDNAKAIEFWQQTLKLLPEDEPTQSEVTLRRNIGHIAIIAKRYALAIEHLHKAVDLNPHMASTFDSLGTAYRKNNQITEALEWYHKALKVDPRWANSISNIGICMRKEGHIKQAIEQFYAAIELKQNHYGAHVQLGKTYIIQKNKELALAYLNKAYDINDQSSIVSPEKLMQYIFKAQKL